ncbi:hypothetical protein [Sinomicrobium weinanense]|uniref:Abnormal spindle-like microcephaly-associated protein ASH domain-containing protein n=1 Tax=Sinomicrobium weinanense TaxID=2842200 RepID=A0A926JV57_9FLAO|nr:hypothetical protein [Sinomicrobium weinanense]MBC9798065.1 hypothetical protein [Sinomicrobium weinanense]MBU3122522.1 hypothetical protein [Sinomicrobium weinanense]
MANNYLKTNALVRFLMITFVAFGIFSCSNSDSDEPEAPPTASSAEIRVETADDSQFDFGKVVTRIDKVKEVIVYNDSDTDLSVSDITLPNGYSGDWTSGTIKKGASKTLKITFLPTEEIQYSGKITFSSNASNASYSIPVTGTGISPVYDGDILLKTQEELEDFVTSGYTGVTGDLCLGSCNPGFDPNDLFDLKPLQNITTVDRLKIFNTKITSLEGIENMELKTGITIWQNELLVNLDHFPKNNEEIAIVNIAENSSLIDINGLSGVTSIDFLQLARNKNLENLDGLANLKSINYGLTIRENIKITHLDALANLSVVNGNISISYNDQLYSFCGLRPLLSSGGLHGTFYVMRYNRYNPTLTEIIDGVCQKEVPSNTYHGEMRIGSQSALDTFAERNYEKVEGRVIILIGIDDSISKINDLSGLSSLREITQSLSIVRTQVTNLDGLNNLTKIGTSLQIKDNAGLSDYCAIVPFVQSGAEYFTARGNLYNPTLDELKAGDCKK